ncbi:hypothetical protein [Candidatus Nitrosotenuis aquarius]|uniref:hypothetical protein n=1 Tax=Candidatus Nitrosotenuis aquarius TaxID=1846278 RepID=UPI001FE70DCC|nr:hypothetical protein [Candidatus Nitrosotenuis aquarius]
MIAHFLAIIGILVLAGTIVSVDAATIKQTMDGAMDVTLEYPDSVIAGRDFAVSIFVQNNGWEDKQNVQFTVESQSQSILAKNQTISIERLSKSGSFGGTLEFSTTLESELGTHYLNGLYSHVLLSNNETPQPEFQKNIAIPILIKAAPEIQLNTVTPTSIFPNAEFPFDIEITSQDVLIRDVAVQIIAPSDVSIRGQTSYTYSVIQKDTPIFIRTQVITDPKDVTSEHKIPFEVVVSYTDDSGEDKTTSKTVSLLLRPRTFMEFTTDGGLWLGGFFLAPYVSIGTIVGIPAGALFSLFIHRLQKRKKSRKKK